MPQTILVIDDHLETLQLTALILTRQGYRVRQALSGADGIAMALEEPPDLILLDIMMPIMDGFETCRQLRTHDRLEDVPIVMFTARSEAADRREAYASGANEYIVKPLHPSVLTQHVQATLETTVSPQMPTVPSTPEVVTLALMGVRSDMESSFIGINLAACVSELNYAVLLVSVVLPEASEANNWPEASLSRVTMVNVTDVSAVEPVCKAWEQLSADTTIDPPAKKLIIINLNHLNDHSPTTLPTPVDHLLICFPPHLAAMSRTQTLLQELQATASTRSELHALLVNLQSERHLTKATVTNLLQYPLLDTVQIDAFDLVAAQEAQRPFALMYPQHQATRQLRQIAIQLVEG